MRLCTDRSSADPAADRHKGVHYAHRALQVAGDDSIAVANVAQPLAYFGEDIGAMTALADRALTLNPSYVRAVAFGGTNSAGVAGTDFKLSCPDLCEF
jgi:hypothetical protein